MTRQDPQAESDPEAVAQRSADRLAVALEDVGFDVGHAFPTLRSGVDPERRPIVELGRVTATVAARLSNVLSRAAHRGITLTSNRTHNGAEARLPGQGEIGTTLSPDNGEGDAQQ